VSAAPLSKNLGWATSPLTFSPPHLREDWKIQLPDWCRDQRNQMTGPADKLLSNPPKNERGNADTLRQARHIAESMIVHHEIDPR
jgi:hypothetical protein